MRDRGPKWSFSGYPDIVLIILSFSPLPLPPHPPSLPPPLSRCPSTTDGERCQFNNVPITDFVTRGIYYASRSLSLLLPSLFPLLPSLYSPPSPFSPPSLLSPLVPLLPPPPSSPSPPPFSPPMTSGSSHSCSHRSSISSCCRTSYCFGVWHCSICLC